MSGIKILDNDIWGVQIHIPYVNSFNNDRQISISVNENGINLATTGDLNADGVKALRQGLDIAEAIMQRGYTK